MSELDREVVVDGELVVWHEGRLDFAALQQRIHPADARARQLSIVRPASYIVFDLLARDGVDLRPLPYRKRRKKLEKLLSHRLPHGLVLMPMSTDRAVAQAWCQPRRGRHRGRRARGSISPTEAEAAPGRRFERGERLRRSSGECSAPWSSPTPWSLGVATQAGDSVSQDVPAPCHLPLERKYGQCWHRPSEPIPGLR